MLKELAFALKLKKAADRGWPLIQIFYPDGTSTLVFPESIQAGMIKYYDPRADRYRLVAPKHRFYLGRVQVIPVVAGYTESLGYDALGALLFADEHVRKEVQQRIIDTISQLDDKSIARIALRLNIPLRPDTPIPTVKQLIVDMAKTLMGCSKILTILRDEGLLHVPTVDIPPAVEHVRDIFDFNVDDVVAASEMLAMAEIADVLGKLAFYRKKLNLKQLLIIAGIAIAIIFLLFLISGALGGAAQAVQPVRVP